MSPSLPLSPAFSARESSKERERIKARILSLLFDFVFVQEVGVCLFLFFFRTRTSSVLNSFFKSNFNPFSFHFVAFQKNVIFQKMSY